MAWINVRMAQGKIFDRLPPTLCALSVHWATVDGTHFVYHRGIQEGTSAAVSSNPWGLRPGGSCLLCPIGKLALLSRYFICFPRLFTPGSQNVFGGTN